MTSAQFGYAWLAFALALALHVTDEALNDFLSVYNPQARAIRTRLPFLPVPTFSYRIWISGLTAGIAFLLLLSPLAFRGHHPLLYAALPLAIVVGIGNALGHIGGSIYFRRWMPGTYSAPVLLLAGTWLLVVAAKPL